MIERDTKLEIILNTVLIVILIIGFFATITYK